MSVETFIGWRYLKAKRRQTYISLIAVISLAGVALGVTALIVVLAVMSGTELEVKNRILQVNSHVLVFRYGEPMDNYQEILPRLREVAGVASAEPFIYSQAMITTAGGSSVVLLRGIDPRLKEEGGHLAALVKAGSLDALEGLPGDDVPRIVLGSEIAAKLGLLIGDRIKVLVPAGQVREYGGRAPRTRVFEVGGIMESGMYDYDSNLAYISLSQAQNFLSLGNSVTGLEMWVEDIYRAGEVRKAAMAELGPSYWARDWMQMNHNFFAALKLQKVTMFIILSLTILVAAFNIISTLIMVVMEKHRDIAILKSMGAGRWSIMKIFVFQGLLIGVLGALAGLAGGVFLCELLARYQFITLPSDIYFISTMPVRMQFMEVALVTVSAVAISLLAAFYPAWQASRLNPVEVLRYE